MQSNGIIAAVRDGSIAEEIGLEVGDKIVAVNGQSLSDIIDLSFAMAEEEIELLIEKPDGMQELIAFDKEYDEELGAEFVNAVFDGIRRCGNRCIFCFVDQIAPNMRPSLSIKDDDYRMSFLYGNFVTLTNLSEADLKRIERLHLSPLFVSVHTTDGNLRQKMLNSKRAREIMAQLNRLCDIGVELHTQIVLCPEINDKAVLDRTIADLMLLRPHILSLAIVPVGLTQYRDNCYPLRGFTKDEAIQVISQVTKWQEKSYNETGNRFVYLGDEFYFLAGIPLPEYGHYDDFPQLENGVGITQNFVAEWESAADIVCKSPAQPVYLDIVCGKSAAEVFDRLVQDIQVAGVNLRIIAVENVFFGKDITVSGLLTGKDILASLELAGGNRSGVIIPGTALRAGEEVFLDDMSLSDLAAALGTTVKAAYDGAQCRTLIANWQDIAQEMDKGVYTWQGNCGYTKNKDR